MLLNGISCYFKANIELFLLCFWTLSNYGQDLGIIGPKKIDLSTKGQPPHLAEWAAPRHCPFAPRQPPSLCRKKTWPTFRITVNCDAPSKYLSSFFFPFSEPCMYVSTSSITFSCIKMLWYFHLCSVLFFAETNQVPANHMIMDFLVLAGILHPEMHPTSIFGLPVWKGWPRWRGHRPVRGGYYGLRCSH